MALLYSHQPVEVLRVCIPQMSICQHTTEKSDLGTLWCQHQPQSENAQTCFDQKEQLKTSQHPFPSRKGTHSYRTELKMRSKELCRYNSKILEIFLGSCISSLYLGQGEECQQSCLSGRLPRKRSLEVNKDGSQEIISSTV